MLGKLLLGGPNNSVCKTMTKLNKYLIKTFFCDWLRIWSHLLENSLIENFIFCAVYFQKKGFTMTIHGNPSTMEFELNELNVWRRLRVQTKKNMKLSDHVAAGLLIHEYDSRRYRFDKKTSFFPARNSKLSGKFICSGLGFQSDECSIIETKWRYQIPY